MPSQKKAPEAALDFDGYFTLRISERAVYLALFALVRDSLVPFRRFIRCGATWFRTSRVPGDKAI